MAQCTCTATVTTTWAIVVPDDAEMLSTEWLTDENPLEPGNPISLRNCSALHREDRRATESSSYCRAARTE